MRHRTPADTGGWDQKRGLVQGSSAASCLWALTVYTYIRDMRPGSVMMQLGLMDVFTWHVRDLQGVQMVNAVWTLTEIYIAVEGDTLIAAAVTDRHH